MKEKIEDTRPDAHDELETARQSVIDAYASFLEAKKHLKRAAMAAGMDLRESAGEHLDVAATRVRDKKDDLQERTGDYLRDNPVTSASLAFLAGVVLSRLLGR